MQDLRIAKEQLCEACSTSRDEKISFALYSADK